jgi:hypothetical protein
MFFEKPVIFIPNYCDKLGLIRLIEGETRMCRVFEFIIISLLKQHFELIIALS